MIDLAGKVLRANFLHAPVCGQIAALPDGLVEIDATGTISAVIPAEAPEHAVLIARAYGEGRLVTLPQSQWVVPGLVDLHVHAPQYPQLGLALDVPLEIWLQHYTFPLEARYADLDFAHKAYAALVADLLANGTTTALYFATVHQEATRLLIDLCLQLGQRALVGKVAMDHPDACPDYYRDASPDDAVAGTRALIDYVRTHPGNGAGRVLPVITPRFIPACTDAALAGLGQLAAECGCHVQSHVSESNWEHGHVLERHGMTDTQSLDRFGLVTRRTVLAHGTLLTETDMGLLAARGSGVAHCPVSNAYFGDGVFPLRQALEKGVHVGLGTDISGGPTASVLETARMAIAASRMLEAGTDPARPAAERGRPESRIGFETAFYLATAGGGEALDLPIGKFEPGFKFDALRIDPEAPDGTMRLFDEAGATEIAQKLIYTASRPNIATVWVDGKAVRP